ncbi:MAG: hypothetical protein WC657_05700 [Candidatus Paceibacterota bacterium]|jgi:hypothetical protein
MQLKATIEGLKAACVEAVEEEKLARASADNARKAFDKAQDVLLGAKLRAAEAKDLLRQFENRQVHEEITQREVDIALMKGLEYQVGDEYTQEKKNLLRDTPALERWFE